MVPFNLFYSLLQALEAGVNTLLDPGSGGTIKSIKQSFSILRLTSAGTRTLPAASSVPVGTTVYVFSSASSATVNSTAIEDGGWAIFVCGLSTSDTNEWKVQATSAIETRVAALEAGYPLKTVNLQTGTTYALLASDSGKILRFTNGSAITVDVPTALPAGFHCRVIQGGAGLVTFQGTGGMSLTTESAALTLDAQDGMGEVVVVATNVAYFATFAVG